MRSNQSTTRPSAKLASCLVEASSLPSPLHLASAATGEPLAPLPQPLRRLADAVLTTGRAFEFLQTLTDTIGPRQSATSNSRRAAELLVQVLAEAGLENVHVEPYRLPSSWVRGRASAHVTAPFERDLIVQSHGWAPSTDGMVEAPVTDFGATQSNRSDTSLAERAGGRIVMAEFPDSGGEPGYVHRAQSSALLAEAGAVALLIPSDKPHRLLDINGFGNLPRASLPMLSIGREDTLLVRRLLARGAVRLALEVENILDPAPATEQNVIAEWRGSTHPGELVILGAHFDSWDTAAGASDDGAGVAAVLATARALAALGARPRRTIRFAFFSGEEQGMLGSRAYVTAHRHELDSVKAVLIMDQGTGAPRGFKLHGRADVADAAARVLAPLRALDAAELSQEATFDQDHAFFLAEGLPVMTLWVHGGDYAMHRHAVTDTLDKIDPRMLALDAAALAVAAFSVADGEPLGRRLNPAECARLLAETHLDSAFRLLGGVTVDG
jgi:carboxypeptidase Q